MFLWLSMTCKMLNTLTLEDRDTTMPWNVGIWLPIDAASYPRSKESLPVILKYFSVLLIGLMPHCQMPHWSLLRSFPFSLTVSHKFLVLLVTFYEITDVCTLNKVLSVLSNRKTAAGSKLFTKLCEIIMFFFFLSVGLPGANAPDVLQPCGLLYYP